MRDQIVERFRVGNPLWSFESGYDPSVAGDDFALMGQSWLDLRFTYQALFDIEQLKGVRWHPADAVGSALSDAWRAAESFSGMTTHPGNEIADGLLHGRVRSVVVNGHHLTTRLLWESASTLDELRPSTSMDDGNFAELSKLVHYKLDEPAYGGAWKVANQLCRGGTTPELFQVVVHIATHPALPYWGWPVTRLALGRPVPTDPVPKDLWVDRPEHVPARHRGGRRGGDLAEVLELIPRQAGVRYAEPITHADPGLDSHPAANQHLVGDLNAVIRNSLFLRHHWSESPSRFILPSTSQAYAMADGGRDDFDRLSLIASAAQPPLAQFADGLWSGTFFRETGPAFLLNAWAHNTLDALITGAIRRISRTSRHKCGGTQHSSPSSSGTWPTVSPSGSTAAPRSALTRPRTKSRPPAIHPAVTVSRCRRVIRHSAGASAKYSGRHWCTGSSILPTAAT